MKKLFFALFLLAAVSAVFADSRVYTLVNPNPDEVLQSLRNTYGDKIHADIVQGKLLVVGSKQQLDEISALLVKLDPSPRALRLTLSEQPPADDDSNSITYSTNNKNDYTIDTVEGAVVAVDHQKFSQQVTGASITSQAGFSQNNYSQSSSRQSTSAGTNANNVQQPFWWVAIDNVPTQFDTLSLQVKIEGGRRAIVLVSYAREKNQERRVFGNTVAGNVGAWIPLLPRPTNNDSNTISSGPKAGEQLYLRVDRKY